jgi:enamine deaminase RidA (YjgF/YER057c/UK114 family)
MSAAVLKLDYMPAAALRAQPEQSWHDVLGVVGYTQLPLAQEADPPVPVAASMTPALFSPDLCEVWRVQGISAGTRLENGAYRSRAEPGARVRYRYCEELVFGAVMLDEARFVAETAVPAGEHTHATALERATLACYGQIFEILRESGHGHLIRVWNYLPEINGEAEGDERYRQFNGARQRAFRASGRPVLGNVPAASALGSPAGSPLSIYFLASREAPVLIENPRQTSAYHYPPQYGAHSPSFSRACVLARSRGTNLFVSGTSSIVGHESLHAGDVVAQTQETLANIEALLAQANRIVGEPRYSLERLKLKVYVRRPEDLALIERTLGAAVQPHAPIVYLRADVCRTDLLVEIEATGETRA